MALTRALPWVLVVLSALLQAYGAMSSGHVMWLAPVPWGLALALRLSRAPTGWLGALRAGAGPSALLGLVAGAQQWGVAYYAAGAWALLIAYHVLVWGLFGALAAVLLATRRASAALGVGALWALLEVLRSFGAYSYPFSFGGMLAGELPLLQLASVTGVSGLSLLLMWTGMALGTAGASAFGVRDWARRGRVLAPLLVTALVALSGALRLRTAPSASETLRVAVLQGSVPTWLYSLASGTGPFRRVVEEHYGALYRQALHDRPAPEVVFFPETTFDWHLEMTTASLRRLRSLGVTRLPPETTLAIGASFRDLRGASVNGIALMRADPQGRPTLVDLIAKRRLVPLIESGHRAAKQWAVSTAGRVPVGFLVCYESMYSEAGRTLARSGARVLAIASDDAGLRRSPIAWTHAQQGRARAVESGLPLVRAGQAGQSYALDAYGRSLAELPQWEVGVLRAELPLHDVPTLYRALGSWWAVPWGALALTPLLGRRRRAPGSS